MATATIGQRRARAAGPAPKGATALQPIEQLGPAVVVPVPASVVVAAEAAAAKAAVVVAEDTDLIPLKFPPVSNGGGGGGGGGGNDAKGDGLDIVSRRALGFDRRAVLFHHIYPFSADDTRTLDILMRMTLLRAEIVKLPSLENVRDYLDLAMILKTSIDAYNADRYFQAVHLAYAPVFAIGSLQTHDLLVDIAYWLSVLGTDSVWLTMDMLNKEIEKTFGVPVNKSPLYEVTKKVGPKTSQKARTVASVAFSVIARDFEARWGEWWQQNHVFNHDAPEEVVSQSYRLKYEYIRALRYLISAVLHLIHWVKDKRVRQEKHNKVHYTIVDVSSINLCLYKIGKATSYIDELEHEHPLGTGVVLFQKELRRVAELLRFFAIASEISQREDEFTIAAWYLLRTPPMWFEKLKDRVLADISLREQEDIADEPEPEQTVERFSPQVAQENSDMFDLVKLPHDIWPRLRLDVAKSSARLTYGMTPSVTAKTGGGGGAAAAAAAGAGAGK